MRLSNPFETLPPCRFTLQINGSKAQMWHQSVSAQPTERKTGLLDKSELWILLEPNMCLILISKIWFPFRLFRLIFALNIF